MIREYRQVLYDFSIPNSLDHVESWYKVENHTLALPIEMPKILQNYDNWCNYQNLTTDVLPVTLRFYFLIYVDGLASIGGFWNRQAYSRNLQKLKTASMTPVAYEYSFVDNFNFTVKAGGNE